MPQSQQKMDADDSAFFARELEHVKAKVWERAYPPYSAWDLFPLSTEADPGDETIVWQEMDRIGHAKVIAAYASDLPRVDVYGTENVSQIRTIGDSYGFSNQDIRAARKAGKPLSTRKAMAARQAAEQKANEVAWFGDTKHGLRGFMQTENANLVVPVTAAASPNGTGWNATSGKTADEILTDLHNLYQACRTASNDVERCDTIVLPTDEFGYINTTRIGDTTTTILQFFRANHQDVRTVTSASELNDVTAARRPSAGATTSANVATAYNRSEEKFTHEIPMMFTQHAEQVRNLERVVPCEMRTGGVIVYRPVSISFMEEI
jgi:hypothetical protein